MSITVRAPSEKPFTTLFNCENEPVRSPGCVQAFAAVFLVDAAEGRIVQFSSNAVSMLSLSPTQRILDSVPSELLAGHWNEACERAFCSAREAALCSQEIQNPEKSQMFELQTVHGGVDRLVRFYVHHTLLFLEVEPLFSDMWSAPQTPSVEAVTPSGDTLGNDTLAKLCDAFCEAFRASTHYTRVLIYRFDSNWNGQVIGEARGSALPSLRGHWFPASDIPANVRNLYLEAPLRVVADALAPQAKLVPEIALKGRLGADLVGCVSRGVSSVHLEYMRNMGLKASSSVALVVEGVLWGIVSAHHTSPYLPRPALREVMVQDAREFSKVLEETMTAERKQKKKTSEVALERFSTLMAATGSQKSMTPSEAGGFLSQHLFSLLEIDGFVVLDTQTGAHQKFGVVPNVTDFSHLASGVRASASGRLFLTDSLPQWFGLDMFGEHGTSASSGLLRFSFGPGLALEAFCFRNRTNTTLNWGGSPFERYAVQEGRIHPRRSFETFRQVVTLQARAWNEETLADARAVMRLLDASPHFVSLLAPR